MDNPSLFNPPYCPDTLSYNLMSASRCVLLLLLLVTPPAFSQSSAHPIDPILGERVYSRKAFDCKPQCKSAPTPELCVIECISPDCIAQTHATVAVDDLSNPEESVFIQTAKKCAVEEMGRVYSEKLGGRMKSTRHDL